MAVLITEEAWSSSQLSIVRYTGQIRLNGRHMMIVNKDGKDFFQCSYEADISGRNMAIEPGEPADLVDVRFIPAYKVLGRDRFIELLTAHSHEDDKSLLDMFRAEVRKTRPGKKPRTSKVINIEEELFPTDQ